MNQLKIFVPPEAGAQYRFNLKAGNGEIILSSEAYTNKASAEEGIASVRANGPDESKYERKDSANGQPYFILKAKNGLTIGRSEMYSSASARDNGIGNHGPASKLTSMPTTQPIPKNLREHLVERVLGAPDEDILLMHEFMLFAEKDRLWREIQRDAEAERAAGKLDGIPDLIQRFRAARKSA